MNDDVKVNMEMEEPIALSPSEPTSAPDLGITLRPGCHIYDHIYLSNFPPPIYQSSH
jgi:hypothetical protein